MSNQFMSMWLSAINSVIGQARGSWSAEMHAGSRSTTQPKLRCSVYVNREGNTLTVRVLPRD
jgi:hypothetical protein